MSILEVKDLQKIYTTRFGGQKVQALQSVSFSVEKGEWVAIMGESGSGKTTLLNLVAALDRPTSGQILLEGQNLAQIKESRIAAFRRDNLGFVFQDCPGRQHLSAAGAGRPALQRDGRPPKSAG